MKPLNAPQLDIFEVILLWLDLKKVQEFQDEYEVVVKVLERLMSVVFFETQTA